MGEINNVICIVLFEYERVGSDEQEKIYWFALMKSKLDKQLNFNQ